MAKKRYVSEELGMNDDVNLLSDFEERVFVRCISIADDYGVLPQSITMLRKRIGFEADRHQDVVNALIAINKSGLLRVIEYNGKEFYAFGWERFDKDQSHIKGKRTQSEYVGIKADTRDDFESEIISKNFVENPRNVPPLEVLKYKAISIKSKAESIKSEPKNFLEFAPEVLTGSQKFVSAWSEWIQYRNERKKPITKSVAKKQFEFLSRQTEPETVIDISIRNQWQGLFEQTPKQNNGKGYKPPETNTNLPAYKPYVDKTRDVKREPMPQDIRTLLQGVQQ